MSIVPEIKIGMTMDQLKTIVENSPKLNNEAKVSIFNFIEEEGKSGDGKITNNIELTMVTNFLKNIVNGIKMPEIKKEDADWVSEETTTSGNGLNIYRKKGENFTEETQQYAGSNVTESWNTTSYLYQSGNPKNGVADALVDLNSDGIADRRELTIFNKNITHSIDTDLDGTFDKKEVRSNPHQKQ